MKYLSLSKWNTILYLKSIFMKSHPFITSYCLTNWLPHSLIFFLTPYLSTLLIPTDCTPSHPFDHPPAHPPAHPPTYPPAHPSKPPLHPPANPSNHPSTRPPAHPPTHPPIHPSNPSIHLPIHPPIHPPINPPIHPPIHSLSHSDTVYQCGSVLTCIHFSGGDRHRAAGVRPPCTGDPKQGYLAGTYCYINLQSNILLPRSYHPKRFTSLGVQL